MKITRRDQIRKGVVRPSDKIEEGEIQYDPTTKQYSQYTNGKLDILPLKTKGNPYLHTVGNMGVAGPKESRVGSTFMLYGEADKISLTGHPIVAEWVWTNLTTNQVITGNPITISSPPLGVTHKWKASVRLIGESAGSYTSETFIHSVTGVNSINPELINLTHDIPANVKTEEEGKFSFVNLLQLDMGIRQHSSNLTIVGSRVFPSGSGVFYEITDKEGEDCWLDVGVINEGVIVDVERIHFTTVLSVSNSSKMKWVSPPVVINNNTFKVSWDYPVDPLAMLEVKLNNVIVSTINNHSNATLSIPNGVNAGNDFTISAKVKVNGTTIYNLGSKSIHVINNPKNPADIDIDFSYGVLNKSEVDVGVIGRTIGLRIRNVSGTVNVSLLGAMFNGTSSNTTVTSNSTKQITVTGDMVKVIVSTTSDGIVRSHQRVYDVKNDTGILRRTTSGVMNIPDAANVVLLTTGGTSGNTVVSGAFSGSYPANVVSGVVRKPIVHTVILPTGTNRQITVSLASNGFIQLEY